MQPTNESIRFQSRLCRLGLNLEIKDGKLSLLEPFTVCDAGKLIMPEQAKLMVRAFFVVKGRLGTDHANTKGGPGILGGGGGNCDREIYRTDTNATNTKTQNRRTWTCPWWTSASSCSAAGATGSSRSS